MKSPNNVQLIFRLDVGFDPDRGFAAVLTDIPNNRQKGIRGNSPAQLFERIKEVCLQLAHENSKLPRESGNGHVIKTDDFQ